MYVGTAIFLQTKRSLDLLAVILPTYAAPRSVDIKQAVLHEWSHDAGITPLSAIRAGKHKTVYYTYIVIIKEFSVLRLTK